MSEWTCGGGEHTGVCVCAFMFLLGDALSSALLHSDSGWKSLLASSPRPPVATCLALFALLSAPACVFVRRQRLPMHAR